MSAPLSRREFLQASAALLVGFTTSTDTSAQRLPRAEAALGKTLGVSDVDGFIAIGADGSVTIYSGKVDLGQGLRIAIPQMAAEELGVRVERIALVEGDTALTPDQGATAGSTGIMRGGVQIRQAAATARDALIRLASARSGKSATEFDVVDGEVRLNGGGAAYRFADLLADQRFALKVDAKAKLRDPASYRVVGRPLPRPDIPDKVTGRHKFVHDVKVDGMLHARMIRPPAIGAKLLDVDEGSIRAIPGARVVRVANLLAVVADDEWDALSAARMLEARWSEGVPLVGSEAVRG
ncbi:MAG TPA: molybdopterin cofactor-binding domain-containing protein, partial [Casimicrobiaceae bacterium]|nr:molybdopterin cofactor-binding domain-containing protein [Casimicrobiaceae bacterium]